MSNIEEQNDRTLDSEANTAQSEEETQNSAETPEQDTSSTPAPAKTQATLYGTRKRRPGATATSTVKTLDQVRGPIEDDEEILMDNLVVKSTAPSHLVGTERSSDSRERDSREREPRKRDRGERRERRERRESDSVENTAEDDAALDVYGEEEEPSLEDLEVYPKDDEPVAEERPERFAARKQTVATQRAVEEFRPSTDGKLSQPKKRTKPEDRLPAKAGTAQGKGFFAWLKSLFISEEAPSKPERGSREQGSGQRRRSGGQGRRRSDSQSERSGERGGNRQRRGRRPQGEGRGESQGEGENRRRRRRRRPQGERKPSRPE